jgi:glycosyltransferase involved in cell wall biosynthesis
MKIDILCPRYRNPPLTALDALDDLAAHTIAQGHDVRIPRLYGSALVHRARNIALTRIRKDADYVLFCDDDMAPERDALVRLLGHGVPVVSALCTTRTIPPCIAAKAYDPERDEFALIEDIRRDKLITGTFGVGAAFLLIQRSALESVLEYHLSGRDWLELNRRQFDRLHVRSENREKERARIEAKRRANWEREGINRVFAFSVNGDELECGEDVHFSRLLMQLGIPVAIDTGCIVGHVGEFSYSAHLLGVTDPKELRI